MEHHGSPGWMMGDDPGVSPVIGVILMVATTVILGTVIGTIVLDFGHNTGERAPSASLSISADWDGDDGNGTIALSHGGGDPIDSASSRVVVSNSSGATVSFGIASAPAVLHVGDVAVFSTRGGDVDAVDWDGDGEYEWTAEGDAFDQLTPGERLTVKLIDRESRRIVVESTVTA